MPHPRILAVSLIVSLLFAICDPSSAQTEKKAAVPTAAEQARAMKLIRELFQLEIDKAAKEPSARVRLASIFLTEASDTYDDPIGRFVLLDLAIANAVKGGDSAIALQAIDAKAQYYALPADEILQAKIDALFAAGKAFATNESYQSMIDSALMLVDDALADDNYPAIRQLLAAAEAAARKLRSVALVSSIRKRQDEVKALEQRFARFKPFIEQLAKNPKDPKANFEVGVYEALVKGNWKRGLPLLARGDGPLKNTAIKDMAARGPTDALRLGTEWIGLAEAIKKGNPLANGKDDSEIIYIQMLLRSYYWNQKAQLSPAPEHRAVAEKHMQFVQSQVPAEYRSGEITAEVRTFQGHRGPVYCAEFSPDGKKIISAGADGFLHLWDVRSGKEIRHIDAQSGRVWTVAFTPDGRQVVSGGFDGSVRLWDLTSGREVRRFSGHTDYVRCVAVTPDGKNILSGGDDRLLRLWNLQTGQEIRTFPGHQHFVWSVALSPDGKEALSASLDKTVRRWDLGSGKALEVLKGHKDTVLSVTYAPNGRRAISASTDKTIILWPLESGGDTNKAGKEVRFEAVPRYIQSVAISPDGRRVLSAGQESVLRLWDAHSGKAIRQLEGNGDQVWHVAFSADGRLALSCGQDGSLRIWGQKR